MNPTMKAVRIHTYGGRDVLRYEDAPIPTLKPDDVLVKVRAAAVNPVDWKVREGYLKEVLPVAMPLILGWDVAGEIVALGEKVTGWQVGDAVYSRPDIGRDGSYAEYIAINAAEIAAKPRSLNWRQAAAVPLAALTAWQSLYDFANITAGERVLIHAGAGGVGSFAIQLAKLRGAHVITTASSRNVEFVRALGADEVIDYTQQDFSALRDIDVVFDTMGGEIQQQSWQVLKPNGRLVSIVSAPDSAMAEKYQVTPLFCFVKPSSTQLAALAALFDTGKLRVEIERSYPLSEIVHAHEHSESGRTRGKIVIDIAE